MKLAIVGCGAIVEQFFLPALEKLSSKFETLLFIDADPRRAGAFAEKSGQGRAVSLDAAVEDADAALIATPNSTHFNIAKQFLEVGKHCLVEKPITLVPDEARELADLASAREVVLAVNQTRRFVPATAIVRQIARSGELGDFEGFTHEEGGESNWPTVSGFYFAKGAVRTGVLMDLGVHVVDWYRYVLGDGLEITAADHDGYCGPEALARVKLAFHNGHGNITLSRFYRLRNKFELRFTQGSVEGDVFDFNSVRLRTRSGKLRVISAEERILTYGGLAPRVLKDFFHSISTGAEAISSGRDNVKTITLLDRAYTVAHLFDAPWYEALEVRKGANG